MEKLRTYRKLFKFVAIGILLVALSALARGAEAQVPKDPLQWCAYRAVILETWGPIPQWKLDIYKRVLQQGIKIHGVARRTTYCPSCSGKRCADGSPVARGKCAASRNIKMGSIIWLEGDGLMKVCDRGGGVKPRTKRETAAFDTWVRNCDHGGGTRPNQAYAVLRVGPGKK